MAELPTGTVTLVFTDIEGSTRLLETLGESYGEVLAEHRSLLRQAFSSRGGVEVDTQGDAFFYAFPRATDAVVATSQGQRALTDHPWPEAAEVRVRMGIHTGEPALSHEGYVGADVHRAARICSAAHGGQVLVSEVTARLLGTGIQDITLRDLGNHGLKDLRDSQHLYQLVIAGLRDDFPAIRSLDSKPNNLPRQLTPLVGRDQEIRTGCHFLLEEDTALLSLTGPGGTGKTRLALALGQELLDYFAYGVFFVDLSPTTDPSLVIPAVASAMSLRESGAKSITETLCDHLAGKEMLLILDNFEQVIEAAPEVSSLLASAGGLKVLVTTREPLRLRAERELQVPPLDLPDSQHGDPETLATSPAVALFCERAAAVKASFELTADNAASVAEICRRLDGLPLALELAAARIRTMSPSSLLARLDRSLEVLTGGQRDLADRQRTLRAAISWSYELLDEDDKRLFCRLGVFAGGFTTDAAETVADQGDLSLPVWDGLFSLVDKSLVRLTDADEERFSMLETIRAFATEKLEQSEEVDEIRRAHTEYFRGLAEEAEAHLVRQGQKEWLPKLEIEHDNIRSALEWCLGHDGAGAVALAGALWRFWDIRSYFTEGRSWLERAVQHSGASSPDLVARVLRGLAALAEAQDDLAYAALRAEEALRLYRSLNRSQEAVSCLGVLGLIAYRQGDLPRARALCEEATDRARDAGDRSGLGRALVNLGLVLAAEDELAEAERAYDEALALQRDTGDSLAAATTLLNLGELAVHRGDPSGAKVLLEEALEHARSLGDHYAMCVALTNLGLALLLDKDGTSASRVLRESLLLTQHMESSYVVACALEALGCAAALEKELRRTAALFGAAHKLRKDSHVPLSRAEERFYESFLASVRRVQDSIEWDKGWGEGITMSVHDAIEFGYDDIRKVGRSASAEVRSSARPKPCL